MKSTTKYHLGNFAVGALGGGAMAFGAWLVVRHVLNRQFASGAAEFVQTGQQELQHVLAVEIPQRVRETIDQKFREANITPDTGRQIGLLLTSLEQLGVLQSGST